MIDEYTALLLSVVIVLIIIIVVMFCRSGSFIHEQLYIQPKKVCSTLDTRCYNIAQKYIGGHQDAANMLARLNNDLLSVIRYMRDKYLWNQSRNPGIIIRQRMANHMAYRYNADVLSENVPWNMTETSYTQDKGDKIAICLREKQTGRDELEDYSDVLFVGLHELAHVSTNIKDHDDPFWYVFKILLQEATDAGIYQPVNYENQPMNICGLDVQYNPYYDDTMREEFLYPIANIV